MFVGVRRLALVVGVALPLGLTACGSDGSQPRTLPPLSTTPGVSTTTPAAQDPKTAEAEAEHVVRQYFRAKNHLAKRMTTGPLVALETTDCPCRKFLTSIEEVAQRGEHFFGKSRIRSLTPSADNDSLIEVLVSYDTSRGGTRDSHGRVLFRGPSRRGITAVFYVRRVRANWLIADIVNIKPGHTK